MSPNWIIDTPIDFSVIYKVIIVSAIYSLPTDVACC